MSGLPASAACLAIACGLSLASAVSSLFAVWRSHVRPRRGGPDPASAPQLDAAIGVLQQKLDALGQEVERLRREGPPLGTSPAVFSGINLEKRSQALRMHRRGEQPSDIAAMLGLPPAEVNLLLKVHRIILRSI